MIEGHSETKIAIIQIHRQVKNEKNLGSVPGDLKNWSLILI